MSSSARLFTITILIAFVAPIAAALEGWYTEEEIRFPSRGQKAEYTLVRKSWYAGDRMRKEEGWLGVTIARFDQGRMLVLDDESRTYFAVDREVLRQNAAPSLEVFGAQKDASGKLYFPEDLFVRTGTAKPVGPWSAYQVTTNPRYRQPQAPYVVIWYSAEVDFPVETFGQQLKNFLGDTPEVEGLFQRLKEFEGHPVRTEAYGAAPGERIVTTLYKVERRSDLDPALFEIPAGYSEMPLPEGGYSPPWGAVE